MLDRTRDTDRKIYIRANSLSSLSNLQILALPAGIHNRTGAAHCTADRLSQIIKDLEILRASHTAAAGHENLSVHDIHCVGEVLDNLDDLHILVIRCESRIELLDHSLRALFLLQLLHNAGTYRRHLRTEIRTCDRRDRISTECRTCHEQLIVLLLLARNRIDREITDLKGCTVCCQSRVHSRGNSRSQVTADRCSAYQQDLRLVFFNNRCQRMCVGLRPVLL